METAKRAARLRRLGWVFSLWLTASAISGWGLVASSHAQLLPGDSLVIDRDAGTNSKGALFRVNPATGTRLLLSDFSNGAQGPLGTDPFGVAVEAGGTILVIDFEVGGHGAL